MKHFLLHIIPVKQQLILAFGLHANVTKSYEEGRFLLQLWKISLIPG